jgi:phospholipid/cholesterol/gamma-HCH transport system substrate-binding protein
MKRAIQKHTRDFVAIVVLIVLAGAVGVFILSHERFRFPIFSASTCDLKAAFSTAQAVTPGQGQSVRVSGVQVGEIGTVTLVNGVAVVDMSMDHQYCGSGAFVHTNATALLRPKTGLNDMFVELDPGNAAAPVAPAGYTIPVQNTLPNVNPDQFLAALDSDTRDYVQLLIGSAGEGLYRRGHVLQAVFQKFLPTHQDLARLNVQLAKRHVNLAHLVHSLNLLNQALAARGPEITSLVRSSSSVFGALAAEQSNLQQAVALLPGTLQTTTSTLGKVQTLANVLTPTAQDIRPAVRALSGANAQLIPFAQRITPVIAHQIRPFVVDARPVVRDLRPAAQSLATATPSLDSSFVVLNHLFNLLGYNQSGTNASLTDPTRQEGYLFWLAWLNHNAASVFGAADANGTMRALTESGTCATLAAEAPTATAQFVTGLISILGNAGICPTSANG